MKNVSGVMANTSTTDSSYCTALLTGYLKSLGPNAVLPSIRKRAKIDLLTQKCQTIPPTKSKVDTMERNTSALRQGFENQQPDRRGNNCFNERDTIEPVVMGNARQRPNISDEAQHLIPIDVYGNNGLKLPRFALEVRWFQEGIMGGTIKFPDSPDWRALKKRLDKGDNPGWKYYKNFTMSFSTLMKFFLCPYKDVDLTKAGDIIEQKNQKYKTFVDNWTTHQ